MFLRPEQAFFSFTDAANTIILLTFLLCCGQIETHLIQEMHLSVSVFSGFFREIALTGHLFAQRPHWLQLLSATGVRGIV